VLADPCRGSHRRIRVQTIVVLRRRRGDGTRFLRELAAAAGARGYGIELQCTNNDASRGLARKVGVVGLKYHPDCWVYCTLPKKEPPQQ
jgi:hypothetical protein